MNKFAYTMSPLWIGLLLVAVLAATPGWAQTGAMTLEDIDQLHVEGEFDRAISALEEMNEADPGNAEVLWRLARARVDRARLQLVGERQEEEYRKAIEEAQDAVAADSRNDEAHLSLSIAAGRVALISDTRKKVEMSRGVKEHADQAIALNPENDLAYHVRGRWNYEVANLGWLTRQIVKAVYGGLPNASFENAAEDLEKAISLKDRVAHRLELGKAYLKLDRESDAKEQLQRAAELPAEYPGDENYQREARELLEDLG